MKFDLDELIYTIAKGYDWLAEKSGFLPRIAILPIPEYKKALRIIRSGAPLVLISGKAGTGKSYFIEYLKRKSDISEAMAIVAPTGVAAFNVGGSTIHSFFGCRPISYKEGNKTKVKFILTCNGLNQKVLDKIQYLVIDEISMVNAELLLQVDRCMRRRFKGANIPFGGVRIIMVGDLLQLPPVEPPMFYEALRKMAAAHLVELFRVHRQKNAKFIEILDSIRIAQGFTTALAHVNQRHSKEEIATAEIVIVNRKKAAEYENRRRLNQLSGDLHRFEATGNNIKKKEGEQRYPAPLILEIKAGAQVMFTVNHPQHVWVNGTLGIVQKIGVNGTGEHFIRVDIINTGSIRTVDIYKHVWGQEEPFWNDETGCMEWVRKEEFRQFPLMLAWAITVHKSQGKTYEAIRLNVAGAFTEGQVYTALSRCRTLEGIAMDRKINPTDVFCNQEAIRYLDELRAAQKWK